MVLTTFSNSKSCAFWSRVVIFSLFVNTLHQNEKGTACDNWLAFQSARDNASLRPVKERRGLWHRGPFISPHLFTAALRARAPVKFVIFELMLSPFSRPARHRSIARFLKTHTTECFQQIMAIVDVDMVGSIRPCNLIRVYKMKVRWVLLHCWNVCII